MFLDRYTRVVTVSLDMMSANGPSVAATAQLTVRFDEHGSNYVRATQIVVFAPLVQYHTRAETAYWFVPSIVWALMTLCFLCLNIGMVTFAE